MRRAGDAVTQGRHPAPRVGRQLRRRRQRRRGLRRLPAPQDRHAVRAAERADRARRRLPPQPRTTDAPMFWRARFGWRVGLAGAGPQSLRARITMLATALFAIAVVTGTVLLDRASCAMSLIRVLDPSASKTGEDLAKQFNKGNQPKTLLADSGGITASRSSTPTTTSSARRRAPTGSSRCSRPTNWPRPATAHRLTIPATRPASTRSCGSARVPAGDDTVLVATDLSRVDAERAHPAHASR